MKDLERQTRQGIHDRDQVERARFNGPRRWRRQNGRSVFVAIRTYPEIKALIEEIADEQEKYLGEVVEEAIQLLHRSLKEQSK